MAEIYPDTNGNGVPDVFENRLPITEVLHAEEIQEQRAAEVLQRQAEIDARNTLIVELEIGLRPVRRNEMYIFLDVIKVNDLPFDLSTPHLIVKRIISAPTGWEPC